MALFSIPALSPGWGFFAACLAFHALDHQTIVTHTQTVTHRARMVHRAPDARPQYPVGR
jgi:hypothetical protein